MPVALFIFLASARMKLFLSNKLNHIWHLPRRQLDMPLEAHRTIACVTVRCDIISSKFKKLQCKTDTKTNFNEIFSLFRIHQTFRLKKHFCTNGKKLYLTKFLMHCTRPLFCCWIELAELWVSWTYCGNVPETSNNKLKNWCRSYLPNELNNNWVNYKKYIL